MRFKSTMISAGAIFALMAAQASALPALPMPAIDSSIETVQFGGNPNNARRPQGPVVQNRPVQAPVNRPAPQRNRGNGGNAAGAAIAAGAAGLIIGGIIASQSNNRPEPEYYPPPRRRPAYGVAEVADDGYGAPPPRSRAWYEYCSQRYRSFDPRSGTYTTPYGERRFCR